MAKYNCKSDPSKGGEAAAVRILYWAIGTRHSATNASWKWIPFICHPFSSTQPLNRVSLHFSLLGWEDLDQEMSFILVMGLSFGTLLGFALNDYLIFPKMPVGKKKCATWSGSWLKNVMHCSIFNHQMTWFVQPAGILWHQKNKKKSSQKQ